jgi:hypothetical protein
MPDVNKDGKLDAITANSASGTVSVLLGSGAGTFTAVAGSPLAMGVAPNHVAAVDLDNDGNLDLVTANTGALATTVGLNVRPGNGAGGFGNAPFFTVLAQVPTDLATADFNLDGSADVALSHAVAQYTYLTGKGAIGATTFNPAVNLTMATGATSIVAAPFHLGTDGLYDVVTSSSNTNSLSISLNGCQ